MSEKERLIELIQAAVGGWMYEDAAEKIADYLIANGVTAPQKEDN